MPLRRAIPLLLTGTVGLGLLGFGLTGLSSVDPQLRSAQRTVERERARMAPLMLQVDCAPSDVRLAPAPPAV